MLLIHRVKTNSNTFLFFCFCFFLVLAEVAREVSRVS